MTSTTRRRRVLAGLGALVALGALTALSIGTIMPPSPRGTDAPPDRFSAARAFAHDEHLGARTHVAGSIANDVVRDYLVSALRGLGLRTEVQDAIGADPDQETTKVLARVRNVVAFLPGTAPTGRLFLVAHYDSVQNGPGGSDDGAGSSTLLETARALTAGTRPRNDVVFVFTDAEEACLCGAEAFAGQHPLAEGGGVVLNFEARGSGGPVIMFETSTGNAKLVDVFGANAPHPVGTSFAVEVYRILPNDTDFTAFLRRGGFTGLNSAYIDGSAVYHTPEDTPSNMDKSSLQHHGDNALALARAFGAADLAALSKPGGHDATYFPVPGVLIRYAGWLVWPVALLAALAVGVLAWALRRRQVLTWGRFVAATGLTLVPLLLAPVLVQAVWTVLVVVRPGYAEMDDPWRPVWYRIAVVAVVGFVIFGWYSVGRRRFGPATLVAAGLTWLALLGLVLAAATPGGSYLAALPALAGAVAGIVTLSVRPRWGLVAATLGAAVAVLVLAPTVVLFFPALGLVVGGAGAFVAALLGLALLPVLEFVLPDPAAPKASWTRRWAGLPAAICGGLALVGVAAGLAVDRFDSAHPIPSHLMYALDTDSSTAWWVSDESNPGDWTSRYVPDPVPATLRGTFPLLDRAERSGPADVATVPAPQLTVIADTTSGGTRTLILNLKPQRPVRLAYLGIASGGRVLSATVAAREAEPEMSTGAEPETSTGAEPETGTGGDRWAVLFHAPPPEGITVRLVLDNPGPVTFVAADGSDGLSDLPGFRPRPADVTIEGTHTSDTLLVVKRYQL